MSLGDFLAGAAFFLPMLAASLIAAQLVVRRRYGHLTGVQRFVAFAVLAITAVIFAHVIPAAFGILYRGTPVVTALLLLATARALPARGALTPDTAAAAAPREPPPASIPSIVIAMLALGAAIVIELARLRLSATEPLTFIDVLNFHLPGVARFIQNGTLWEVDQFAPFFSTAQYPNNGDFLNVALVLPWHDLAFVRVGQALIYGLTGVGVYGLALELRSTRAAAATFAALAVTIPSISNVALEGMPDNLTLAMLPIGLMFLVRYERSRLQSELLLGGLALGLSFGTKWYGVTSVVVVVAIWALAWLVLRRPFAATVLDTAKIGGMVAVGGGIWLVRNLIESGDPFYPKTIKLLGSTVFGGSHNDLVDRYGYTIVNYLGKPSVLRKYIWHGFSREVGIAGLVIVAGLIVAAVVAIAALRRAKPADRGAPAAALALVMGTLGICVLYSITPGSAYGLKNLPLAAAPTIRWLMPAAVLGAALAAAAVRQLGRAGLLLELAALAGLVDSFHLDQTAAARTSLEVAAVLVVVIAGGLLLRGRLSRLRSLFASPRPAFVAPSMLAVVLVAVGVLRLQQTHFDRHSYAHFDPVFAYVDERASSRHRIGITGQVNVDSIFPMLPAMGPRLDNYAAFVGDKVVHSLAEPSSKRAFAAELRNGRFDLLEIGLENDYHTNAWAQALGYRLIVKSKELALYSAPGRA